MTHTKINNPTFHFANKIKILTIKSIEVIQSVMLLPYPK